MLPRTALGNGSAVLSAMHMVSEQERRMQENEDDDEELLSMFPDGLGKRTSRMEVLLGRAKEAVATAESEEREAQLAMTRLKEQVSNRQLEVHVS